ncbi:glycosyltransferase, partial [Acinetobacter baumannii]
MHICMVMAGDEEGGLEKHVVELANGLAQAGQKVTLIAHEKYAERVSGVEFKALDLSKSRKNPILLWQLYQTIKATHAD